MDVSSQNPDWISIHCSKCNIFSCSYNKQIIFFAPLYLRNAPCSKFFVVKHIKIIRNSHNLNQPKKKYLFWWMFEALKSILKSQPSLKEGLFSYRCTGSTSYKYYSDKCQNFSTSAILNHWRSFLFFYLEYWELSKILSEPSLIILIRLGSNFRPEKLHSDGNANKLYVLPVTRRLQCQITTSWSW